VPVKRGRGSGQGVGEAATRGGARPRWVLLGRRGGVMMVCLGRPRLGKGSRHRGPGGVRRFLCGVRGRGALGARAQLGVIVPDSNFVCPSLTSSNSIFLNETLKPPKSKVVEGL
jgi:hypothetical protein